MAPGRAAARAAHLREEQRQVRRETLQERSPVDVGGGERSAGDEASVVILLEDLVYLLEADVKLRAGWDGMGWDGME